MQLSQLHSVFAVSLVVLGISACQSPSNSQSAQSNPDSSTVQNGAPTSASSPNPTSTPTGAPTSTPTVMPTTTPTSVPTSTPTNIPTPVTQGSAVTSFQLSSATSGSLPFTLGMGFRKGALPSSASLSIPNSQVIVMKRWNDNSIKHAIISGDTSLTANQPITVQVLQGAASSGTPLTAASIQAANPSATVSLGTLGSVSLSSLLSNPIRTFISGPEMVEAHYMGSASGVLVYFHVRYYKSGRIWIRTSVENGFIDVAGGDKSYTANVTIGGNSVYSGSITQYNHTRWSAEGWIGVDPQVSFRHNTVDLVDSKLVPNYMKGTPSETKLNSLYTTYHLNEAGNWTPNMGETGYQDQIGLLPDWDALYITSNADARAFSSVIANAKALNSYPIIWRGSQDGNLPVRPSAYPTYTFFGAGQGGGNPPSTNNLIWEMAHHGSGAYLAYLLTGDYYYLETMQHQAGNCYLTVTSAAGSGVNRILGGQPRGVAWCLRTYGQLDAIAPNDSVTTDYTALLASQAKSFQNIIKNPAMNQLGFLMEYCPGGACLNNYSPGQVSVFMHDFMVQTFGMNSDLEPLSDMTTWNAVRDFTYKLPVGLLGSGGAGTYCFNYASNYTITVAPGTVPDLTQLYSNWGQVFTATNGSSATCGNTLLGSSGGAPEAASGGYWGNLMPAISYAVDHGASGASDSWARLTGASNWNAVLNSGFGDTPLWGIVPRGSSLGMAKKN